MRRRTSTATASQLALSFDAPPVPAAAAPAPPPRLAPEPEPQPDPLAAALAHHEAIDSALRAGGPNPLPGELTQGEWEYSLIAFRTGGPYDCELLQEAEAAVEILVEMLPEPPQSEPEDDDAVWSGLAPGERGPWEDYAARGYPAVETYLPEEPPPVPDSPASVESACWRIYRESLADLTDEELDADLLTASYARREGTAALIAAEIGIRERRL